jgi:hypothetical protein
VHPALGAAERAGVAGTLREEKRREVGVHQLDADVQWRQVAPTFAVGDPHLRKNGLVFECFPCCVCPEPVLVKRSCLAEKVGGNRDRFRIR